MFKLVQVDEDGHNNNNSSSFSKFVQIIINWKHIKPMSTIQKKKVLSVSDFAEIVEKLMSKSVNTKNFKTIVAFFCTTCTKKSDNCFEICSIENGTNDSNDDQERDK